MRKLTIFLLVLFMLAAVGCGTTAPADDPADEKPEAEELIFSGNVDPRGLDPQNINDGDSIQVTLMLYNYIVRFDDELNIHPDLAERWEVSDDELTWTFYLREGVEFHNGKPVDATAVKASFDRILDQDLGLIRTPLFAPIKEVTVVDDYVVAFTTHEPCGFMLSTLAHTAAGIIDAEHAYAVGKDAYMRDPIGSGPYRLVNWITDQELVLERNDDYWGDRPAIKRVIYRPIPEASSRLLALESGETDVITHVPETELTRLEQDPNLSVVSIWTAGQRGFRFNLASEVWDDPRTRQAAAYAIDRRAIVDNLMMGQGRPSVGPLSPVVWGAADLGGFDYDPDKARQLLAEAGYPDGFDIHIVTTPRYAKGVDIAEALQAYFLDIGIRSTLEVVEWGVFTQNIIGGLAPDELACDLFIMGFATFTGDADWGLRPVYTTQPTNENNYGFYSNAEFDNLIFEAMRTTDQDLRRELYRRAQEIVFYEDPSSIWLFDTRYSVAARADVRGLFLTPFSMVSFQHAWFE